MSGGADMFKVLSQTEDVGPLIADTRPAMVVERTGSRLLWANAAGAAFFGVATVEKLAGLRFSPASPFARRISTLDDTLASGQDRIERLPLQRGLLPRPTVCKASRVVVDGTKAVLLTIIDGTGSLAGDPVGAFAALAATAPAEVVPESSQDADVAPKDTSPETAEIAEPAPEADTAEWSEAESESAPSEPFAESNEAVACLAEPLVPEMTGETPEQVSEASASTIADEAPTKLSADTEEVVEELVFAEPVEGILPESVDDEEAGAEVESFQAAETLPVAGGAPAEPIIDVGTPPSEASEEQQAPVTSAFAFPDHGRAVRFVFELDPLLAFTFVSADLATTVGPAMADILGRTWAEVASRLEFDPAGRIAEALGHRDTFTGLTVDWPVEGQSLRVPADLAGMPVFGRERSFRGYRGFGVLKTGAAFEAPVPVKPIAASEPEESQPLPPIGASEPESTFVETTESVISGDANVVASDAFSESSDDVPVTGNAARADASRQIENATGGEPDVQPVELDELDATDVAEQGSVSLPAEAEVPSGTDALGDTEVLDDAVEAIAPIHTDDRNNLDNEAAAEDVTVGPPAEPATGTFEAIEGDGLAEPVSSAEETEDAAPPTVAAVEDEIAESDAVLRDEAAAETDTLPEPLPIVTPPGDEGSADADDSEPPVSPVTDVTSSPVSAVRTTLASLSGDKANALSKPERDAFDKIAEALADAFGPRLLGEPTDRTVVPQMPAGVRKTEEPAEAGPTIDIALLDKLPVALAILKGGDIIHANRAFLDLCGYADVASIDADGGFAQVFEGAALNRDAAIPAIRRRDGVEIPVSAKLHSLPLGGGIASLLVVQETVAATSRDRLAIAEQRAEDLEAILDTATDGVLVLDHKGLVIGANKSAEALFGNERSHMIGMAFVDLLAPESHRSALDYLDGLGRNALSSVLNDGREVIGRVDGGGLVPLFMTVGRVSTTKFCAVLRDITQWKRAEEELTSAKKAAENASSQKSDFLAKMSHEIRTPLNAIIGFSEVMMEERFGPVGNDRYKEYLRDIHVSGTHIMSLVNDLLDLSKIEAGKLELTFEAVGLNDVVRECAALMQPQANRERIIIRTSLSSSLPPVVADNRSLRQIILNLLSNAVKFNSAGGQVIISTLYEESGEVVLRVRDTGQGMSEGDIVKAMEPFRQLSTSRTGGGTGLGLPLTKALVEANRASFQIDSSLGQGTMIQITFPSTRVLAE